MKRFSLQFGICVGIFGLSLSLFLFRIEAPQYAYFDENAYISAARQIVATGSNENWAHPPLGKVLIGASILAAGDRPFGWRMASALAGGLTVVGMYLLASLFFASTGAGLAAAGLALTNQVHFVHSRMATLDVFMVMFIVYGLYFFARVLLLQKAGASEFQLNAARYMTGILIGLAGACKWVGLFLLLPIFFLLSHDCLFPQFRIKRLLQRAMLFIAIPALTYFAVQFLLLEMRDPTQPMQSSAKAELTYSIEDLVSAQLKMAAAHFGNPAPEHPFVSSWYSLPLSYRPMWLDFKRTEIESRELGSGVLYMGNPFVFAVGIFSLIFGLRRWFQRAEFASGAWLFIFLFLWLVWAFVPWRNVYLFYYYPAAMVMNVLIIQTFRDLRVPALWILTFALSCVLSFLYFYPLMTSLPVDLSNHRFSLIFMILR